jgi:hypothetical protein
MSVASGEMTTIEGSRGKKRRCDSGDGGSSARRFLGAGLRPMRRRLFDTTVPRGGATRRRGGVSSGAVVARSEGGDLASPLLLGQQRGRLLLATVRQRDDMGA